MIPAVLRSNIRMAAISKISAEEMAALVNVIRRANPMDIDNIDASWLPWLAQQWRVPTWNAAWTEELKRRRVKEALPRFKTLGTPFAIDNELEFHSSVYGIELSLKEWFEMVPQDERGTFRIIADNKSGISLGEDFYNALFSGVESVKRKSQHWRMNVLSTERGIVYCGGATRISERTTQLPESSLTISHFSVNGWDIPEFKPVTSFAGAFFTLAVSGNIGEVTIDCETTNAVITGNKVEITGPGEIKLTLSDRLKTIDYTLTPRLFFYQDGSSVLFEDAPAYAEAHQGRIPHINEMVHYPNQSAERGFGSLWSEWGDMGVYGWAVLARKQMTYMSDNVTQDDTGATHILLADMLTGRYTNWVKPQGNSFNLAIIIE